MQHIRNYLICAHVDHGKSTLADRMLEITGTVPHRLMKPQYLDQLELERERGITIKMAPVRMHWRPSRGLSLSKADSRGLLYEDLTYKIRGALFKVYNTLGPGHKELVYQNSLALELEKIGLAFEREKRIDVMYDGKKVGLYQPDFVIEGRVVIELKALPFLGEPPKKQTRYYLRGSSYRLAILVNFGASNFEIERIIYDSIRDNPRLDPRESASSEYILNLIDTPGHSDFSYEVSRAMSAVEGAIVLVDATQGIQAQTLSNFEQARKARLAIIGAVSKIDAATPEQITGTTQELARLLNVSEEEIFKVSGKTGEGVIQLLEAVIKLIPPPKVIISNTQYPITNYSRALVFDSLYDDHKGVIAFVRVFGGEFRAGETMRLIAGEREFKAKEVGYFSPKLTTCDVISSGEIGYVATGIKDPNTLKIGDTICGLRASASSLRESACEALPGYKEPNPVVFVSFYPEDTSKYDELKQALAKLHLTDAALRFEPDMSEVLGRGFKGGFLGRLHFEIAAERLNREFHVQTVHSFPSVAYRVKSDMRQATWTEITNPKDFPSDAGAVEEPMTKIEIVAPPAYLGAVLRLKELFRFSAIQTKTLEHRVVIEARLPLADLVSDFDDKLKSATAGFASFNYEIIGYAKADVEKLDILVAGHPVPGLSRILPREDIEREGRLTVEKLKKLLPQQAYAQALQAVSRGRVLARETIPALRKDVTGYLYGGDRSRKMKLWKKQQRGKARLKELAAKTQIRIPASVFKELLKK